MSTHPRIHFSLLNNHELALYARAISRFEALNIDVDAFQFGHWEHDIPSSDLQELQEMRIAMMAVARKVDEGGCSRKVVRGKVLDGDGRVKVRGLAAGRRSGLCEVVNASDLETNAATNPNTHSPPLSASNAIPTAATEQKRKAAKTKKTRRGTPARSSTGSSTSTTRRGKKPKTGPLVGYSAVVFNPGTATRSRRGGIAESEMGVGEREMVGTLRGWRERERMLEGLR